MDIMAVYPYHSKNSARHCHDYYRGMSVHLYDFLPLCSSGDCINDFHNAMQGRVSSNGHVGSTEVIINRTHKTHNVQMGVLLSQ